MSDDLRYPIGNFQFTNSVSDSERETLLRQIADTPAKLREAVHGLDDEQLATPYRPDGWNVRQVVHQTDARKSSVSRFPASPIAWMPT